MTVLMDERLIASTQNIIAFSNKKSRLMDQIQFWCNKIIKITLHFWDLNGLQKKNQPPINAVKWIYFSFENFLLFCIYFSGH